MTTTIPVGVGPEGVAFNPVTSLVYVVNSFDKTVLLINAKTSTVTATVAVGHDPTEVAVNSLTATAFVTNTDDNTVSVITN